MNKKFWVIGYLAIVMTALIIISVITITVDPYFHYHVPNTDKYYYDLNSQRCQNDGITKNFDYQGIITGTSMTENFKTSLAEEIFGAKFIKVSYAGGPFYEINSNLEVAAAHNKNLKYVIRGLDQYMFFDEKDKLRTDLGTYPTYLYDDNIFNDVEYLFNREVIFSKIYPMMKATRESGFQGGITPFDKYSRWMESYKFGLSAVYPGGVKFKEPAESIALTEKDIAVVKANIQQNVTALAKQYPNITFYYFMTPYSIAWWRGTLEGGSLDKQIDAEKIVIEEILTCENIKLFSFNTQFDIITNLNHYKDTTHYGSWINDMILYYIYEGKCQLTWDNYESYIKEEREFYKNFNYDSISEQEDYAYDYLAEALIREQVTGIKPHYIDIKDASMVELQNAVIDSQTYGNDVLICKGTLSREPDSDISISDFLKSGQYVGAKIIIPDISDYKFLVFSGRKVADHGQMAVRIFDENGNETLAHEVLYYDLDNNWVRYVFDCSNTNGPATIYLNGGFIDKTGSADSQYLFKDIVLY